MIARLRLALVRAAAVCALACAPLLVGACSGGGTSESVQPTVPSAPTGVHVTLLSLSSVRVDWTANAASQGVRSYNVLRNGTKVGETTVPMFTDTGLSELQTYKYTVQANGSGSVVSANSDDTGQASFTVPDLTAPRVTGATPASGATGVLVSAPVTVTFSEPILPGTLTAASFTLKTTVGGAIIAGSVSYVSGATTASFTPTVALASNTSFTATVSTDVKDVSGNQLANAFTTQFTTALPVDNTPPTITASVPTNGAADVSITSPLTLTFSEPLAAQTVSATSVTVAKAGSSAALPATVTYNVPARQVTLTPAAPLDNSAAYVLAATTALKDTAGNALLAAYSATFTTIAVVDNNPPTVLTVSPAPLAVNISINTPIVVTFSETMNAATINSNSVKLTPAVGGGNVSAALTFDALANRVTLVPSAPLAAGVSYVITVSTAVKDLAGNALANAYSATFTTLPPDTAPPTVLSTQPVAGATNVSTFIGPTFVFSEALNATTVTSANFSLKETISGAAVAGTVQYLAASNTLAFLPTSALGYSTSYAATVGTGVRDIAGNALAAPVVVVFTTSSAPAVVTSISPALRATNVPAAATVQVTFSVPIKPVSLSSSTFILKNRSTGLAVPGLISYNATTRVATLTPSAPLSNNSSYAVSVTGGVTDVNDVPIASGIESCFTPGPGTASAATMTGFWSGDSACGEIHWHLTIVQTGNTLSLSSTCAAGDCQLSATSAEGLRQLGGASFAAVTSLTGTVSGTDVNFTFTTSIGITLTYSGSFATPPAGSANPWIIGTISGGSIPPGGLGFERQRP